MNGIERKRKRSSVSHEKTATVLVLSAEKRDELGADKTGRDIKSALEKEV